MKTHAVEFLVVQSDPGAMGAAVEATARAIVARGLAASVRFRATTEGGQPALGVAFHYDILDGVPARDAQIARILARAPGWRVAGQLHFREGASQTVRSRTHAARTLPPPPPPRKKTAARPPKPVYTKEYLAAKGRKRRNPVEQFRMPGGHSRMHLTDGGVLDVAYGSTDWSRPGAAKRTLRILPTSTGHRGTIVRDLIGKDLTADALLAAAIEADESAKMMYDSYPRHVYRSAAHYYEGLALALLQLASQLQSSGWRTNPKAKAAKGPKGALVWQAIRTRAQPRMTVHKRASRVNPMERPGAKMGLVQFVHRTGLKVTLLVDLSRVAPAPRPAAGKKPGAWRALLGTGPVLQPTDIVGASGLYAHTASRSATSWWLGAAKGYGPAVLYAAAALHGGPVRPSTDQTAFASQFWDRQGTDRIEITPAGYRAKFGVSPTTLLARAERAGVSARAAEAAFDDWWPAYYGLAERHTGTRPPFTPWEDARAGRHVPPARSRYAASMQDEDRYVGNPTHRAPNEAIVRPQRFGLQPVRGYFGQVRPYEADVVVSGDLVLRTSSRRPLWVVGTDAQGQPVLAETKAAFEVAYAKLVKSRRHVASFELPVGKKRPRWPR